MLNYYLIAFPGTVKLREGSLLGLVLSSPGPAGIGSSSWVCLCPVCRPAGWSPPPPHWQRRRRAWPPTTATRPPLPAWVFISIRQVWQVQSFKGVEIKTENREIDACLDSCWPRRREARWRCRVTWTSCCLPRPGWTRARRSCCRAPGLWVELLTIRRSHNHGEGPLWYLHWCSNFTSTYRGVCSV